MNSDHVRTPFYRATLTALFVGIMATLLCLGYDIFYRDETGFSLSTIINVSSIIFLVNLIFLIVGVIYSMLISALKKADAVFVLAFLIIILFCIWGATGIVRSSNHEETVQFRGLLIGILVIMGIGVAAIPYLFHNRKFEETVL
jgi:p-aminobenzoyl-glutamate transporter AbgT